jgi:2-polyprenyl-3-methyl-5-hydroxy-6-metoxy-1,4-benzoquinol methylase
MAVPEARVYTKDGFEIVRCPSCGLVFRAYMPASDDLGAIYSDAYFTSPADSQEIGATGYLDYVADEELHRVNARKRLEQLRRHAVPGRLLDVGCAAGFFLDEARRAGWDSSGIELSTSMASWAQDRLGLPVERVPFGNAELEPHAYDAITMWDYIEHSVDPAADLKRSHHLLKPGGILALSTGDVGSLAARLSGSRWHLLTPRHHNYFFQPHTIRRMLERSQFSVVSVGHPAGWYSVRYLAHKLRTMIDRPAVTHITDRLHTARVGRVQIPLNLGDIMVVVARAR